MLLSGPNVCRLVRRRREEPEQERSGDVGPLHRRCSSGNNHKDPFTPLCVSNQI
jgi:hypothetical protein